MKGATINIVVVLVTLLIGLIVGGWNRRAKSQDQQLQHNADLKRARDEAFAAGHRKGWAERESATTRDIQMTCDRIDGHKSPRAIEHDGEESFI